MLHNMQPAVTIGTLLYSDS